MTLARYTDTAPTLHPCVVCGRVVNHRECEILVETTDTVHNVWWSAERHHAPCGAPCIGGGVKPIPHDRLPPGVSGIAHAHRKDGCGTPNCKGGIVPRA